MSNYLFLLCAFLFLTCAKTPKPRICRINVRQTEKNIFQSFNQEKKDLEKYIKETEAEIEVLKKQKSFKLILPKYQAIFLHIDRKIESNKRLVRKYKKLSHQCKSESIDLLAIRISAQENYFLREKSKVKLMFDNYQFYVKEYHKNKKIRAKLLPIIKKYEAKCKPQFILQGVKSGCEDYFTSLQKYCATWNPMECPKDVRCVVRGGVDIKCSPKIYLLVLQRKLAPLTKKVKKLYQNCVSWSDKTHDTCLEFLHILEGYCPKLSFKSLCEQHKYCIWEPQIGKSFKQYCLADRDYLLL